MKRTKCIAIGTLLLLWVGGAAAQSLGDYAREARKSKPKSSSASRHYDNDNLPTGETLSVIGPPPSSGANADNAKAAAVEAAPSAADRQKTADEWQKKLAQQKEKINSLRQELDLDQRELRLRAAAAYSDPTIAVRNVQWNKQDAQYKNDVDAKQKALEAARQQLDEMQEQAHKAGIVESEKDNDNNKEKDK